MSTSALNVGQRLLADVGEQSITWSSVPSPSRSRTKQSLPVLRRKITRPVTATRSPVRVSGSSSCPSYVSRISASVWVRSTVTG